MPCPEPRRNRRGFLLVDNFGAPRRVAAMRYTGPALALCTALLAGGCSDSAVGPRIAVGAPLVVSATALATLDAVREGHYVACLVDRPGTANFAGHGAE